MDKKTEKLFQKELTIPCHIHHIADRVLKVSREEAKTIIDELLSRNVIEESCFANNYYKIK
jgi:uncharacterized membrane protein YebE (DUF533 family)